MYTETAPEATASLQCVENNAGERYGYQAQIHLSAPPTAPQIRLLYELDSVTSVMQAGFAVQLTFDRRLSSTEAHSLVIRAAATLEHRLRLPGVAVFDTVKTSH